MKKIKDEKGALIVEASIVFPTMFLVIFFLIYVGNAYYQKCRVEAIVNDAVIEAAAWCADPLLASIQKSNIPNYDDIGNMVKPYRYILTGEMINVKTQKENETKTKLDGMSTGFFGQMKPHVSKCDFQFHNAFIYSTVSADVVYDITVPVRLLGMSDFLKATFATHVEKSVLDVPEFIRNMDMVEDMVERLSGKGFEESLTDLINRLKNLFNVNVGGS